MIKCTKILDDKYDSRMNIDERKAAKETNFLQTLIAYKLNWNTQIDSMQRFVKYIRNKNDLINMSLSTISATLRLDPDYTNQVNIQTVLERHSQRGRMRH